MQRRDNKSPLRKTDSPRRSPRLAARGRAADSAHDVESPRVKDKKVPVQQKGLAGDWGAIALLLLLYTLQGIPMGLGASLPMLMQEKGVSTMEQAVFSTVAYPFAFKLLWAPLVDSVYSSSFGRRKTWIVPAQMLIGLLLLAASARVNGLLGGDGGSVDVQTLTGLFFTFYFLAATQDIAVDGLALTILSERNKEYGATCNAIGQTFGYFLSYVGFLGLNAFGLATLGSFMTFWGVVFLGSTLCVLAVRSDEHVPQEGGTAVALGAAYHEMWLVLKLPAVKLIALVLLTCKAPLACFDALVPLELQAGGVPKERLAMISIIMLPVSMMTQAYVSRNFSEDAPPGAPKPMQVFLTSYKARLANGGLSIALIAGIAYAVEGGGSIPLHLYGLGVLVSVFAAIASAAMFVAQMAFFNRISDPKIGGTYMTMLNTISNLGGQWPGTAVLATKGAMERLGAANGFYGVAACSLLAGVAWLLLMGPRVLALQAKPKAAWLAAH